MVWVVTNGTATNAGTFRTLGARSHAQHASAAQLALADEGSFKLQLNGHDRFAERGAEYFRYVQPYQHHKLIPSKFIYSYS